MKKVVTVSAGLSNPSTTDLLVKKIAASVNTKATAKGESIDLSEIKIKELTKDLLSFLETGGINSNRLETVKKTLSKADGLISVTPIFSASYSGLFKLFFAVLDPNAINGMPVIIGATAGTPRHSLALDYAIRPLMTYFRAQVVPTGVFAATEDFGKENKIETNLLSRVERAAGEFTNLLLIDKLIVGGFIEDENNYQNNKLKRKSGTTISEEEVPDFINLLKDYL